MGKPWTAEETAALEAAWRAPEAALVDRDAFCEAFAAASGRTENGVRLKLQRMGLLRASRGSSASEPAEPAPEPQPAPEPTPEPVVDPAPPVPDTPPPADPDPAPWGDVGPVPPVFSQDPLPPPPGETPPQPEAGSSSSAWTAPDASLPGEVGPGLTVGMVAEGLKAVCGMLSAVTGAGVAGHLTDQEAEAYAEGMQPFLARWASSSTDDPAKVIFLATAASLALNKGAVYYAAYELQRDQVDVIAAPTSKPTEGQGDQASRSDDAEPSAASRSASMPGPPAGMMTVAPGDDQ